MRKKIMAAALLLAFGFAVLGNSAELAQDIPPHPAGIIAVDTM